MKVPVCGVAALVLMASPIRAQQGQAPEESILKDSQQQTSLCESGVSFNGRCVLLAPQKDVLKSNIDSWQQQRVDVKQSPKEKESCSKFAWHTDPTDPKCASVLDGGQLDYGRTGGGPSDKPASKVMRPKLQQRPVERTPAQPAGADSSFKSQTKKEPALGAPQGPTVTGPAATPIPVCKGDEVLKDDQCVKAGSH